MIRFIKKNRELVKKEPHAKAIAILMGVCIATNFLLASHAGELPPNEMKYPNVITPVHQFGTFGQAPGLFNNIQSVSASADDRFYLADTYNFRIQELALDGTPIKVWNLVIPETGERVMPVDVEPLPEGGFVVLDARSDTALFFNRNGKLTGSVGKQDNYSLKSPTAIRFVDGKLYIADAGNARIVVLEIGAMTNTLITAFGSFGSGPGQFKWPADLAVDLDGAIYVADSDNNRIQKFSSQGQYIQEWGEWGSYSGMLATPIGLHLHGNHLFVADLVNHRIQVFNTDGSFAFQFGRHPPHSHEGNGRIHYPTSVAVTPNGKFTVVCEPFEHRCQVFDEFKLASIQNVNDSAWWDKATRFHYGTKVAIDKKLMAITEPDTHSALLFDIQNETPKLLTIVGGQGSTPGKFIRPSGAFIDGENNRLFISDSGNQRIQIFDILLLKNDRATVEFNSLIDLASHEADPSSIALGPDNKLWILDSRNSRMMVLDQNTWEIIKVWGTEGAGYAELNKPLDFAFSRDELRVYVADHYNQRVQVFDLNGNHQFEFGRKGENVEKRFVLPFGIARRIDDSLYVTDVGSNQVLKFTEEGELLITWGQWGSGPKEFYKPKGIAQAPDGRVFVIDFGNHRGQIFAEDGSFLSIFGLER